MELLPLILLGVVTSLIGILGLVVLLKNTKDSANRYYFAFSYALIAWMLANFFIDHAGSHALALILTYATFTAPALAIYFLFCFCHAFTRKPIRKKFFIPISIVSIGVALLGSTSLVVAGIEKQNGIYAPVFGPLGTVYAVVLVGLFAGSVFHLVRSIRHSFGLARVRLRFVIWSLVLAILFSIITNLVIPLVFNQVSLVVYGPFSTLFMVVGFSYAIIRHRLFDIRLIVARSLAYVLLLGTLGGIYSLGLFGISNLLFGGNTFKTEQVVINMVLALLLVFTFQPLRRFFERITDKIFYRDKYDSQQLLNDITQVLAQEIDLQKVLDKTLTMIAQAVRVSFGQYLIFEEGKVYKVEHYGKLPERLITTPELKVLNRSMLVADELEAGNRKDVMDQHGIRLSLALRTKDEFVGFLLLGDKLSGDIYSTQDIELFQILANELAVAIVNAKAYEEIARFNITLQDKVNQATSRLRVANHNLKELDKAKDEFISMASHQLRTPLTTIKGYISMLQEGDAGKVSKEQNEFLGFAYDGSERMVGLISDLLNVSRMNSGKFMIDRTAVDPVAMVSGEVRQLQSHADAKQLKLVWMPPKTKLPNISIDEGKTRQVIMNFIDNAIYYTRAGSVTVTLKQLGDQLELRVSDTGIGVPEAARAKLFKKFFRAGNAQQLRPDGTGLGLYLAKRVVEDQGGKILFESTEGKGSMFGFSLPYKTPVAPTPKLPNPASKPITKVTVSS